jgi:hypothetical protein
VIVLVIEVNIPIASIIIKDFTESLNYCFCCIGLQFQSASLEERGVLTVGHQKVSLLAAARRSYSH